MDRYKLSKRELQILNQGLIDCQNILDDLERAKNAGVPNIESIEESVNVCQERINKLKSTYASNKK